MIERPEWRFTAVVGRWSIEWTRFVGWSVTRTDFCAFAVGVERGLDLPYGQDQS